MMWAVGARYGYDTMILRLHWLRFYHAGHQFMADEERRTQEETLAHMMGSKKA